MNTGIYTITNLVNGKIYVGSSTSGFDKRWWRHLSYLRANKHKNTILQNSWNKYGESNFRFEVLEECEPKLCVGLEQYWINLLGVTNRNFGYNIRILAKNNFGLKHTEETKLRMSNSAKKYKRTEEHQRNLTLGIRKTKGSDFKIPKIKKTKEEMRLISLSNIAKVNVSHLSSGELRKLLGKRIYQYTIDGDFIKEWESIMDASEFLKCKSPSSITNCLKGLSKTGYGFKWKYKENL